MYALIILVRFEESTAFYDVPKQISQECKDRRHDDGDGYVMCKAWFKMGLACDCPCGHGKPEIPKQRPRRRCNLFNN
jgi:hypothetical protein